MPLAEVALVASLVLSVIALVQALRSPRLPTGFAAASLRAVVAWLGFLVLGGGLLYAAFPEARPDADDGVAAFAAAGFVTSWVAIGVLWLVRLAPRLREPPAWLLRRWSVLDAALILLVVVSLAIVAAS